MELVIRGKIEELAELLQRLHDDPPPAADTAAERFFRQLHGAFSTLRFTAAQVCEHVRDYEDFHDAMTDAFPAADVFSTPVVQRLLGHVKDRREGDWILRGDNDLFWWLEAA